MGPDSGRQQGLMGISVRGVHEKETLVLPDCLSKGFGTSLVQNLFVTLWWLNSCNFLEMDIKSGSSAMYYVIGYRQITLLLMNSRPKVFQMTPKASTAILTRSTNPLMFC